MKCDDDFFMGSFGKERARECECKMGLVLELKEEGGIFIGSGSGVGAHFRIFWMVVNDFHCGS